MPSINDTFIFVLVAMLAIQRLATYISSPAYAGPFGILDRFRRFVGVEYDEYSIMIGRNEFAKAIICMDCLPTWLAILFSLSFSLWPTVTVVALAPFAIGGAVMILEESLS